MCINELIKKLTLNEKAKMVCGYQTMETFPVPRLNIPSLILSDGPNGLRKEDTNGDSLTGISNSLPATCFPSGATIASTWDKNLVYQVGEAIAKECKNYNVDLLLGPAINIKRNPKCGRNFEYYSEDPYLSGEIGAAMVNGIQSKNVGATLKHFACNNNEKYRFIGDSILDQRTLREIYLKPFEIAVKKSHPYAIMSSYNKINGTFASENGFIQNDVLRNEWGFDGLSLTDWGGIVNRDIALVNGTDLEMPGMVPHNVRIIVEKIKKGELKEEVLDLAVKRILSVIEKTKDNKKIKCDFEENCDLAASVAVDGAVLLKNENVLPLSKKEKYLVVGGLFKSMRYQGSGSSLLNPYKLITHENGFKKRNIEYEFVEGYKESDVVVNPFLENEVINKCKDYATILFYGGQNDFIESEGYDRDTTKLSDNQLSLLTKLIKLNKKVVLVLFGGSSIEMPYLNDISAVLNMMLPGEAGGEATAQLLFGEATPSGRLTETWAKSYNDVPFGEEFISSPNELYKEALYVGYRYYDSFNKKVLFPFGYGLSYTEFEYKDFKIEKQEDIVRVNLKLKNIGKYKSKETIQIYAGKPKSNLFHAKKELVGFEKAEVDIDEEKSLSINISIDELKSFDINKNRFVLETGNYTFYICKNINEVIYNECINLKGEIINETYSQEVLSSYDSNKPYLKVTKEVFEELVGYKIQEYEFGKRPYTWETPIGEMDSFMGKIFKNSVCNVGLKQYKKGCKMKDSPLKEREKKAGYFVYRLMPTNSLRSLCYSSSGGLKYHIARGMLEMVNGHYIKGIKEIIKGDKEYE